MNLKERIADFKQTCSVQNPKSITQAVEIIKELEAIVEMQETAIFSASNALLIQKNPISAEDILILAGKKNIQLMKGE